MHKPMQLKAKNLNFIFKNFVFGQSRVLIEHIFFGDKPKSAAGVKPLGGGICAENVKSDGLFTLLPGKNKQFLYKSLSHSLP